jgi:hypothetical protein
VAEAREVEAAAAAEEPAPAEDEWDFAMVSGYLPGDQVIYLARSHNVRYPASIEAVDKRAGTYTVCLDGGTVDPAHRRKFDVTPDRLLTRDERDVCWDFARSWNCPRGVHCRYRHNFADAGGTDAASQQVLLILQGAWFTGDYQYQFFVNGDYVNIARTNDAISASHKLLWRGTQGYVIWQSSPSKPGYMVNFESAANARQTGVLEWRSPDPRMPHFMWFCEIPKW